MPAQIFGGSDKFYAAATIGPDAPLSIVFHSQTIAKLQEIVGEEARGLVSAAFKRWNVRVREQLRRATGLKLVDETTRTQIRVIVQDGLPSPLAVALDKHYEELAFWVLGHKSILEATKSGLDLLNKRTDFILSRYPNLELDVGPSSIEIHHEKIRYARLLIESLLKRFPTDSLKQIYAIEQDILGAYFFRRGEIHLYWLVIGLFSKALDISVEDMTVIVLAHELAHAYTHLGLDIDGNTWSTDRFAGTDLAVVEGLAEFYTEQVAKALDGDHKNLQDAFAKMSDKSPDVYRLFKTWAPNHRNVGEVIRQSMIEARLRQVSDHATFLKIVESAKKQFTATSS